MGQSSEFFTPVRRQSLADLVYQHIRGMILSGELASGADVNIRDLSKRLEVSTIPVREALVRLTADGLVTANRNHRATVVRYTTDEMLSAIEYRLMVETSAVRLAAERISPQQIAELRDLNEQIRELSSDANADNDARLVELNSDLHCRISEATENPHIAEQVERCNEIMRVIHWLFADYLRDHSEVTDHTALIDALAAGDAEAAAATMADNIEKSREILIAAADACKELIEA